MWNITSSVWKMNRYKGLKGKQKLKKMFLSLPQCKRTGQYPTLNLTDLFSQLKTTQMEKEKQWASNPGQIIALKT